MVTADLAGRPAIISGDRSGGTRQRLRSGSGAEPRESQPRARPAKTGRWSFPRTRRYFTGFGLAGLARPPDVSSAMHWYPVVTFWQVTADLR